MPAPYRFIPSRGGRAPGYLRDALLACFDWDYEDHWFERLAEDPEVLIFRDAIRQHNWDRLSGRERAVWLCGQLWNCSDILPRGAVFDCELNDIELGGRHTYACLVRELKSLIPPPGESPALHANIS